MALSVLLPLLLGGVAVAEATATASNRRRKPEADRPEAAPRRSGSPAAEEAVTSAYRALVRGTLPNPVPSRLARGLDCLISGILAPLAGAGVSGRLVPLVDPSARTPALRDGLALGLRLDPDSTDPGLVVRDLPGVEALPPDAASGRDFWIFGVKDLRTGAALLDHLAVYGPPSVSTTNGRGGTALDADNDGTGDFYFDTPGEAGPVDLSSLPRMPV